MNGNGFQRWIMAVVTGAAIAAVGGSYIMYGKVSALEAEIRVLKYCIPSFQP